MTILHQHMAHVAEFRLLAFALARQERLRIGGRLVGIIATLLTVKIDGRIATIVILRRSLRRLAVFALETLVPGPRFNQCTVYREVLIGEQPALAGVRQDRRPPRLSAA